MRETAHLSSSAIPYAAWDSDEASPDSGLLSITFSSGSTYEHQNVPRDVWEGLQSAASPGRYYHDMIKGQY